MYTTGLAIKSDPGLKMTKRNSSLVSAANIQFNCKSQLTVLLMEGVASLLKQEEVKKS